MRKSLLLLIVSLGLMLAACGNGKNEKPEMPADDEYEDASVSGNEDAEEELSKADYLKKLNDMEEEDRLEDTGTTTVDMEEQASARFEKWDTELNRIYGALEKQLDADAFAALKEEQLAWIAERDQKADEASAKYEGGTMKPLEYITTKANLTKERCYELVNEYMK